MQIRHPTGEAPNETYTAIGAVSRRFDSLSARGVK
jgi:hypothetical protein